MQNMVTLCESQLSFRRWKRQHISFSAKYTKVGEDYCYVLYEDGNIMKTNTKYK